MNEVNGTVRRQLVFIDLKSDEAGPLTNDNDVECLMISDQKMLFFLPQKSHNGTNLQERWLLQAHNKKCRTLFFIFL